MAASRYSVGIGPVPVPPALGGSSTSRSKPLASTRQRQPPSHLATTELVSGRPAPSASVTAYARSARRPGANPSPQAGAPEEGSYSPRVELEGAGSPGGEGGVEDVQRAECLHPVDEVLLAEPVEGAHGKP